MSAAARRPAVLAALLTVGLLFTGCGSVYGQTQWAADGRHGVIAQAGEISIRGTVVVADDQTGQATVLATLANDGGRDELVRVRVGSIESEPEGGALAVPANGYARLGPDGARLDVQDTGATPGRLIEVEFIFATAPRATVNALVQPPEGIFAGALN